MSIAQWGLAVPDAAEIAETNKTRTARIDKLISLTPKGQPGSYNNSSCFSFYFLDERDAAPTITTWNVLYASWLNRILTATEITSLQTLPDIIWPDDLSHNQKIDHLGRVVPPKILKKLATGIIWALDKI